MTTDSSILAWEIPWTEGPGYSPWGRKKLYTTEWLAVSFIPWITGSFWIYLYNFSFTQPIFFEELLSSILWALEIPNWKICCGVDFCFGRWKTPWNEACWRRQARKRGCVWKYTKQNGWLIEDLGNHKMPVWGFKNGTVSFGLMNYIFCRDLISRRRVILY